MNRKNIYRTLLLALFLLLSALLLSSCGASSSQTAVLPDYEKGFGSGGYHDGVAGEAPVEEQAAGSPPGSVVGASEVRHVIRNGSMNLIVEDTRQTVREIQSMAKAGGGIISASNIYEMNEGQYAANLTLRVPEQKFDYFMGQLQELGKATESSTSEDDVTMQYLDLETRIKNLQAQEERLREILDMASTVEEVLQVESELSRVRGEIEVMTTKFTYLQDRVSYATINLHIREEYIATQHISGDPFENLGTRMKEALVRSVNFVVTAFTTLLVVLTALLPVLLALAVIGLIIRMIIIRIRRRKKAPPAGGAA